MRGRDLHATGQSCQSLGGVRLDQAVAAAFLEAVTPAGVAASAGGDRRARGPARRSGWPASASPLERAEFEADRARRQFDACEPEHRLVARTLERALEEALAARRARARQARRARAGPPGAADRRRARARSPRLARDLPRLWNAPTTTDRDRKELLRTLIREVDRHRRTAAEAPRRRRDLLGRRRAHRARGAAQRAAAPSAAAPTEDTVELIRRLAAASPRPPDRRDPQHATAAAPAPACRSPRRASARRASAPASPPPRHRTPTAQLVTIHQAAAELGVSTATIRRWLRDGLLPGEQTTPAAPWRIRLTDEIRARFVPDIPDGFVALDRGRRARSAVARQTVLHKVQRGELPRDPSHPAAAAKGSRIDVPRRRRWTV